LRFFLSVAAVFGRMGRMELALFLVATVLGPALFLIKTGFGRRHALWTAMLSPALIGSASLWWRASRNTALLSQEAVADVPRRGGPSPLPAFAVLSHEFVPF
jgi:hypothetical protein